MSAPATGHVPAATVVVVVRPSDPSPQASLDAVLAAVPEWAEVVVVANGAGPPGLLEPIGRPGVRIVRLVTALPFAAAAGRGAAAAAGRALCFVAPGASVTPGWLPPLLSALEAPSVGCAVPMVVDREGRVVEAGWVVDHDDGLVPWGADEADGDATGHLFPRSTGGGSRGCICVDRADFAATGGFDPVVDDAVAAGVDLADRLRTADLETVYEPASRVVVDGPHVAGARQPRRSPAARDARCPDRILVLAAGVPSPAVAGADRRAAQLVGDLAAIVPDGRVTVLALEGDPSSPSVRRLLRDGIEVVTGAQDWPSWFGRRSFLYTHVLLTDLRSVARFDPLLRETQPQAMRILSLPSLPFGHAAGRPDDDASGDAPGRAYVDQRLHDQVVTAAASVHAAWWATARERAWVRGIAPGLTGAVIPTAAEPGGTHSFDERAGYVVLATPGADVVAGHEGAALHAARHVLPALVARDPTTFLRVVVDDPSPALQLVVGPHLELVDAGDDPARWFRRSRVGLALYPEGSGAADAIALALDAGTPFVGFHDALVDHDLGRLRGLAGVGGTTSAVLRAGELHARPGAWAELHAAMAELSQGLRSRATARLKLVRACADVGIRPPAGMALEEPARLDRGDGDQAPVRPRRVARPGSAWKAAPPAPDGPAPDLARVPTGAGPDENEQYRRWCAVYGPTPTRLARLARRLERLDRRPTLSIVMPVFDTEPAWLDDAIRSVRDQVYGNWELCIGDDGSTKQATLDVLDRHAGEDARIRTIHLPVRQGISAASNAALSLATGDLVGFLDHDDELKPHALGEIALALDDQPDLDMVYTDEDKREPDGRLVDPFFKPDWSPDQLMSQNYVCHLLAVRRSVLQKLGGLRSEYDGSQDYDLVLRVAELTSRIGHVPEPLYTWRKVPGSTAGAADAKPWALDAGRRALLDALARRRRPGQVEPGLHPTTYRVRYAVVGQPRVSILVPTRDKVDMLRGCIDSVVERSTYTNYEFVVVDNQSAEPDTLAYLRGFAGRVVPYPFPFNYARMMNLAASEARGDLLLFLNNDTQVITPDWLEAMIEHAQRPEVGIVGPRLLYPDGNPQHEGTIVGHKGGHAGNVDHGGYHGLGEMVRNCSAVTGACMMIRPSLYWRLGGHEERLRIAWNDVDLCLRVRQAGHEVVYTPFAQLFHVEGGTRGYHAHVVDDDFFEARWVTHKCLDPYYNANLERLHPFRIRS
ncbi:MAG TPA: glycosyltransferase [Acidimicrobiales bacterium]|nr:glycosyltransferase [Acidimicrobiales bacterium]